MTTDIDRFMAKVCVAESGCWLWIAGKSVGGYGRFTVGKRSTGDKRPVAAHRWAYEYFVGPIPAGMTIDHQCHNRDTGCNLGNQCPHRGCVNPEHLQIATQRANILRGRGHAARNATALTCVHGHPLSGDNLLIENGRRRCRTCIRRRINDWQRSAGGRENARQYRQTPQRQQYAREYRARNAEAMAEYQRRYYEENRERTLARQKARRETDPAAQAERQKGYTRTYYEKNAEAIRAKRRARRAANLEQERERDREYQRRKREKGRAE